MHAAALQSAASAQLNQRSQLHKEHVLCTNAWKSAHKGDVQVEPMVIDVCGDSALCSPLACALQDFREVSCDFLSDFALCTRCIAPYCPQQRLRFCLVAYMNSGWYLHCICIRS